MEDLMKVHDFFGDVLEKADDAILMATLCMLLDLCEAKVSMPFDEMMDMITEQRKEVNMTMGAYPMGRKKSSRRQRKSISTLVWNGQEDTFHTKQ